MQITGHFYAGRTYLASFNHVQQQQKTAAFQVVRMVVGREQ